MASNAFFKEDYDVYTFGDDIGGMVDLDDFNDDTFGGGLGDDAPPVGRDFDFAGSTSRFLGAPAALVPAESSWTNTDHAPMKPSPWMALNSDPLLSSTPVPRQQAQPQQPQRVMRSLEEVEAELRGQSSAQQPPQQQRTGRPLTLEEVEADMVRNARMQQQQPQQKFQQPQQQHFQQQQQFGASPQLAPQQRPYPPQGQSSFPPPGQPFGFPPGMNGPPPPHFQHLQQQHQQQQFFLHQQHLFHQAQVHQAAQQGRSGSTPQLPLPQAPNAPPSGLARPPQVPLGNISPNMPNMMPNNMIGTLFPPLPSQASVATVEQQLQYLTMNQHAQHPSLTGAQLQALLQQAQAQAQKEGSSGAAAEETEGQRQSAAGEELIRNVESRIREHEAMEHKRKRKADKIASMSKHNNLMSNSDKDFITRIQVSQLVTDDPYADDFYFHIMAAIKSSRHNALVANAAAAAGAPIAGEGEQQVRQNAGNGGRNGGRGGERKPTRRENAMSKMAQNVQRLVDVAKQRNNRTGQLSLDGALGKIALRTRSAPRQLLQVPTASPASSSTPSASSALLAGLITSRTDHHHVSIDANGHGEPLSHRAVLAIVEEIYDSVLDLEQLRRIQPALLANVATAAAEQEAGASGVLAEALSNAATTALAEWDAKYAELTRQLWSGLRVMEPLDISNPHPFISLVSVMKGKRILPRALRHLSAEQTLTLVTLMVATFDQLDTVREAPILDRPVEEAQVAGERSESQQRRAAVEVKTEAFLNAIISPVMSVIGNAPLRMVTGMLGLLLERNDIHKVVKSKPGVAFLTIFLSRAESLKQSTPPPDAQDLVQWQQTFTTVFHTLAGDFPSLFPSTRAAAPVPFGASYYLSRPGAAIDSTGRDLDLDDEPIWRFLAAVAVCADPQEQQTLVTSVRDKVMENVSSATKSRVSPEVGALKIRNLNLLLHALGLDSSQLTVDE